MGGASGEWKIIFPSWWTDMNEHVIPFDFYLCSKCGRIQLYADKKVQREIIRKVIDKIPNYCPKCKGKMRWSEVKEDLCFCTECGYEEKRDIINFILEKGFEDKIVETGL